MRDEASKIRERRIQEKLHLVCYALSAVLLLFAVIAQPDKSLLTGFWKIQISPAGLITDPLVVGGVGAGLLNAAVVLALCTLLVRTLRIPFTGISLGCLFMMAGFAMLGKNVLNIALIIFGGWLYAKYEGEPFSKFVYMSLFGTCLGPMVSYMFNYIPETYRYFATLVCGVGIGFLTPAIAGYTVRIHQGYNLYNVGFASGILGLGIASVLKGFGIEFSTVSTWGGDAHWLLCAMYLVILVLLFGLGMRLGCRTWVDYRRILRHSGRSVADFIILDGPARTLVNMAVTGLIGFVYLLALYPLGVRLNGPLMCGLLSIVGFGAFGKHPKNCVPVMAGAVLATLVLGNIPINAPGVLLATLFCTGLAPIAGQFGWLWGVVAGFVHMAVVQNTSILHGGMNLYNNGFSAGLVCILLIPLIEALKPEPEE